ncbi:MAG TPA: response regulator [Opitutaceae bacterium]|jgi:CheY-like chemotaxis protein
MSDPSQTAVAGQPGVRATGPVLVIDDDELVGIVLSRALGRLGYAADSAPDGRRGVALFEADPRRYGLVFLDYKLPGMDSAEVCARLRAARPDIPVVLMSGYSREDAMGAASCEFSGFLKKPFTVDSVKEALTLPQA